MSQSLILKIEAANLALITQGNVDAIPEFFAPDYIAHLTDGATISGHQAIRKVMEMYHHAFTDMKVEVEILVKSKDRIAWQRTTRATHTKAFKGFPGTGRPMVWRDMVTSRFKKGLIAEEWVVTDLAERFLLAKKR